MTTLERWIDRLMRLLRRERHDIGRKGLDKYLTRYVIWGQRFGPGRKVFLHLFHRGDAEPYFHDHPFAFWSLILWGGYVEHTLEGKKWYGPLSLLRRPATWQHRVEVPDGKQCLTLVWTSAKVRSWGFWCRQGWIPWRQHEANQAAGKAGCGDE